MEEVADHKSKGGGYDNKRVTEVAGTKRDYDTFSE